MFGTKLILDIHDIVPEFFASKFNKNGTKARVKANKCFPGVTVVFNDKQVIVKEEKSAADFHFDNLEDKILGN